MIKKQSVPDIRREDAIEIATGVKPEVTKRNGFIWKLLADGTLRYQNDSLLKGRYFGVVYRDQLGRPIAKIFACGLNGRDVETQFSSMLTAMDVVEKAARFKCEVHDVGKQRNRH